MSIVRALGGRHRPAVLCALGLASLAGCGGGEFKKVPVGGTVTLDGQPLNGGVLHFYPDTSKGNQYRVDCLSPVRSGKYELLTTAVRSSDTGSGAPLGWYKVYLDTTVPGAPENIHPRFTTPEKTTVSVEVVENPSAGAYDIKFTSK
jgi:hypothetical protein